jgi:PAS domain S-box-containing protein
MGADQMKPRLLIADDEAVVRGYVTARVRDHFTVVGEASDADTAIELARSLHPDVVLLDVEMPGGGLYATQVLREEMPGIVIVVLSSDRQRSSVLRFLQAGASAYLRKGPSMPDLPERLLELLEQAAAGPAEEAWSRPPVDERVRAALEQADLGVAIVVLEGRDAGRVTMANAAYARLLGRQPGELVGASVETWTHPDDLPEAMDHPLAALATGKADRVSFQTRYLDRFDHVVPVSVWAVSHRGPDGERVAIMQVPAPAAA